MGVTSTVTDLPSVPLRLSEMGWGESVRNSTVTS